MSQHKTNGITRSQQAYREILRYLHRKNLSPGDTLPSQAEFVSRLAMSHTTVSEAMRWLVEDGILSRKPKTGTRVESVATSRRKVWSVGVPISGLKQANYHWVLLQCVRNYLAENGCNDVSLTGEYSAGDEGPFLRYADLHDTENADRSPCLNLIISRVPVVGAPIPALVVGGAYTHRFDGVAFDNKKMLRQACLHLSRLGCVRLALMYSDIPQWTAFQMVVRETGLRLYEEANLYIPIPGIAGGRNAADYIAGLDAKRRPDGIVTLDDHCGLGLCDRLRDWPRYRPALVVATHRELPRLFGIAVYQMQISLNEMARLVVSRAMDWLLRGIAPKGMLRYDPRLNPTAVRLADA